MNVDVPLSNISSGVDLEKKCFEWAIGNFNVMRLDKSMIDSQEFPFTAGGTPAHPSQSLWTVLLQEYKKNDKRWIGIFLKLESPGPTDIVFQASYLQFGCIINNKEGKIIKKKDFGPLPIATGRFAEFSDMGFDKFIDADDANLLNEESLVIHITFKLYAPSQAKSTSSLDAIKEKFQVTFMDQLRKDFDGLLEIPDACTDIKIISSDKKEFSMKKGILAVRSEVFAAMLRSGMIEANSGVIKLSDVSSKAVEIFLIFLKTGVLLRGWSEAGVIVELTNAAAEYQLKDLLQFLDATVGKVCQLENVLALATLARQLSLKGAEEELMLFVRKEGVRSMDNVLQMWNTEVRGIGSVPTPGEAANKGTKRKKNQSDDEAY